MAPTIFPSCGCPPHAKLVMAAGASARVCSDPAADVAVAATSPMANDDPRAAARYRPSGLNCSAVVVVVAVCHKANGVDGCATRKSATPAGPATAPNEVPPKCGGYDDDDDDVVANICGRYDPYCATARNRGGGCCVEEEDSKNGADAAWSVEG